ncbi:hypothetical protein OAA15_00820 [bacterium]|nr:hypothetical protein [bacterium]
MTPKEKANELGNKFYQGSVFDYSKQGHLEEIKRAKERALICVDEILESIRHIARENLRVEYWEEVKQEIEKLFDGFD